MLSAGSARSRKRQVRCWMRCRKKQSKEAAGHGLLVLTGGPGTGKTTTINAIIRFFESEGAELRLAAPTGRAAKRMTGGNRI